MGLENAVSSIVKRRNNAACALCDKLVFTREMFFIARLLLSSRVRHTLVFYRNG